MAKLIFPLLIISNCCFAKLNYEVVVQEVIDSPKIAIASYKGITPKIGDTVILPFSKSEYCLSKITNIKNTYLLLSTADCVTYDVKVGQRGLVQGYKIASLNDDPLKNISKSELDDLESLISEPIKKIPTKNSDKLSTLYKKIYITGASLGSSTVTAKFEESVNVGHLFLAESVFGQECKMPVISTNGDTATLDSSDCPFERDLFSGQELKPIRE